jgi:hypothetical protein
MTLQHLRLFFDLSCSLALDLVQCCVDQINQEHYISEFAEVAH